MPKIAIIGAGSVVFTRRLLGDVLSFPSLADSKIALMDIDAERLELISGLANRLVTDSKTGAQIEATTDRAQALDGADFVITTIRVGDDDDVDRGIPQRLGIDQAVGDTIGPGGIIKALRTVPALLDICHDMERLCPNAWLLNYTNPMAIACWAISEATTVPNVGLCHSVQNTARQLSEYIGADQSEMSYWTAGINHMAWFLKLERNGVDAYPNLFEAMDDPRIFAKDTVRFEVLRQVGYFVSESTRHMSEYVPYFRGDPSRMERFGLAPFDLGARAQQRRVDAHYDTIREELESNAPMVAQRTNEYAAYIMDSMETGTLRRVNVNVKNTGLIPNLPDGSCVEVPCLVDETGVHPCYVGELQEQCAALIQTNINVQRLTVKSILEQNCEAAIHAAMLDPLTSSKLAMHEIRSMMNEMFSAQPEFFNS